LIATEDVCVITYAHTHTLLLRVLVCVKLSQLSDVQRICTYIYVYIHIYIIYIYVIYIERELSAYIESSIYIYDQRAL